MPTAEQLLRDAVERPPKDATVEDAMDRIDVLAKVARGTDAPDRRDVVARQFPPDRLPPRGRPRAAIATER